MRTYYNTNKLAADDFLAAIASAKSQQEKILIYFQSNPGRRFAPHQIKAAIFSDHTPITSIRRAITNLEKDGFLTKTDHMISGDFGSPVHTWELKHFEPIAGKQQSLFG